MTIIGLLLLGLMGTLGFASQDLPGRLLNPDAEEHPFRRLGKPYVGRELKWQHEHPDYPRHLTEANGGDQLGAPLPSLWATPDQLGEGTGDIVTVFWRNVTWGKAGDWIGMFAKDVDLSLFHAPIKFKFASQHGDQPGNENELPPPSGNQSFRVLNLRQDLVFYYISGNHQYPSIIAKSNVVAHKDAFVPLRPRLGGMGPGRMEVIWNQKEYDFPKVMWSETSGGPYQKASATAETYTKSDLCDNGTQPAGREGYFDPGKILRGVMCDLKPDTEYFYIVGDDSYGWTKEISFRTAPDDLSPISFVAFGDQGTTSWEIDRSFEHSWDFEEDHGEVPVLNTTANIQKIAAEKNISLVLHFGDISYATGYLSEWDEFMGMLSPVGQSIPWMASIGNHEMGWSKSLPSLSTTTDSGGECGIPFLLNFPFAQQQASLRSRPWLQREPWYSFDAGLVHFVMISSEHDFTRNSPQWLWLEQDLMTTAQDPRRWIIATLHRPMYISSAFQGDLDVGNLFVQELEPLLLKYNVDVLLSGHHHAYQRLCYVRNGTCTEPGKGVRNFVMGMAGYQLNPPDPKNNSLLEFLDNTHYGVTLWEVANSTHAKMSFISNDAGAVVSGIVPASRHVVDEAWVVRPLRRASVAAEEKQQIPSPVYV